MQRQIDGGIDCTHLLCALGKSSGKDEYPYHQEDILIGSSYRELIDTLVQFQAACNGDGITGRDEESHCDRYFIKVVDEDGSYQIEAKEYE